MKIVSLLLLLVGAVVRPSHAHCPQSWWLHKGVRASGEYSCAPLPPDGVGDRDLKPQNIDLDSRVYCTGGSVAITNDGRTVGCQARH